MADENPGESPTPAAPEQAPGETPAPAERQPTAAELAAQLADVQKRLRDANREAAERRKKLEAFEAAETERKAAEMTETQKLQAKLEKLEAERETALAQANARLLRAAILAKAAGTFADPEDVVLVLSGKLTLDEAGEVEGLDQALKDLAKAKPHWLKSQRPATPLHPGMPGAAGEGETEAQQRARVYGEGVNVFNPSAAREKGGGVFFPPGNET